ncbi:MAG TPA: hypothetical protein VFR42_04755 [Candidatus Acidoferrum sp.]|nr:hypothetical protein [Candidatus Acidoferrum sp.]
MAITFTRVKDYLNAIANNANLDAGNAGHRVFWNTDYNSFFRGNVPSKSCNAVPVPIINQADKVNSAFFLILKANWCTSPVMPQMPRTGPFVTDNGYTVQLPDKSTVTGAQILTDIENWLKAGAPENG